MAYSGTQITRVGKLGGITRARYAGFSAKEPASAPVSVEQPYVSSRGGRSLKHLWSGRNLKEDKEQIKRWVKEGFIEIIKNETYEEPEPYVHKPAKRRLRRERLNLEKEFENFFEKVYESQGPIIQKIIEEHADAEVNLHRPVIDPAEVVFKFDELQRQNAIAMLLLED